jgi:hypothetical protein
MNIRSHASKVKLIDQWWVEWVLAIALLLYCAVVLFVSACAVNHTWPGNRCAMEYFRRENEAQLLDQITADSLRQLHQAEGLVAGWRRAGITGFSGAELQSINQGLALAAELASSQPCPAVKTNAPQEHAAPPVPTKTNGMVVRVLDILPPNTQMMAGTNSSITPSNPAAATPVSERTSATLSTAALLTRNPSPATTSLDPTQTNPVARNGILLSGFVVQSLVVAPAVLSNAVPPRTLVPLAGDLSKLSDAKRLSILSNLDCAIVGLQKRAHFLATNACSECQPGWGFWFRWSCPVPRHSICCDPGLTASEVVSLQARNGELSTQAFRTCSKDFDLMILLMALGAVGATAANLSSIAKYHGDRKLLPRWLFLYGVRPIIGGILAMLFYFLLAGKLMTIPSVPQLGNLPSMQAAGLNLVSNSTAPQLTGAERLPASSSHITNVDPGSVIVCAALALLVGLFSEEAMQNLADVADALFHQNKNKNTLESKIPRIVGIKAEPIPEISASGVDLGALTQRLKKAAQPTGRPPPAPTA